MIQNRYFESTSSNSLISAQKGTDDNGGLEHDVNLHVLSDPTNFNSAPVEGWAEVSEARYNTLFAASQVRIEQEAANAEESMNDDRRLAYEEALDLGFSSRAASAMSGYTPPE